MAYNLPDKLRSKLSGGSVMKAHLIWDDKDFPNGMYGVAHVFGDSESQANHLCRLLADRYNMHEELVRALKDCIPFLPGKDMPTHISNLIMKAGA